MNGDTTETSRVVAIDGPSGVGKSTVARAVAARLGLPHLDTGSTYRAATVAVLERGVDPYDPAAIGAVLESVAIGYENGVVMVDGRDVTTATRGEAVTAAVSPVAAVPEVRVRLVGGQRQWVADHGGSAVVEGRDIGTTVFPDAPVRVYLTADPEVRAARRVGDPEASGRGTAEIAAELTRRDEIDSTREASPLAAAPGATVIDTTDLTVDQVVKAVLDLATRAGFTPTA